MSSNYACKFQSISNARFERSKGGQRRGIRVSETFVESRKFLSTALIIYSYLAKLTIEWCLNV